jgi:hypothetical protein
VAAPKLAAARRVQVRRDPDHGRHGNRCRV